MANISQPPVRNTSGATSDPAWGPLANCGCGNPFFYHEYYDDFDFTVAASAYTATKTGNGTIAHAAGDGGTLLFTTNSSTPVSTDLCSIQLPAASFKFTAGKKMFMLARFQLAASGTAQVSVGLQNTGTTPFAPTDGLFFNKPAGASTLQVQSLNASAATNLAIPTTAFSLTNNSNLDVGWYVDRNSNVFAFVGGPSTGQSLVGYFQPESEGTAYNKGAMAAFAPTLTTATLNLTFAVQSGSAASTTMTADFIMIAKER